MMVGAAGGTDSGSGAEQLTRQGPLLPLLKGRASLPICQDPNTYANGVNVRIASRFAFIFALLLSISVTVSFEGTPLPFPQVASAYIRGDCQWKGPSSS